MGRNSQIWNLLGRSEQQDPLLGWIWGMKERGIQRMIAGFEALVCIGSLSSSLKQKTVPCYGSDALTETKGQSMKTVTPQQ